MQRDGCGIRKGPCVAVGVTTEDECVADTCEVCLRRVEMGVVGIGEMENGNVMEVVMGE